MNFGSHQRYLQAGMEPQVVQMEIIVSLKVIFSLLYYAISFYCRIVLFKCVESLLSIYFPNNYVANQRHVAVAFISIIIDL